MRFALPNASSKVPHKCHTILIVHILLSENQSNGNLNLLLFIREDIKMQVSKKIKLELSDQDAATLEFMQAKCRGLYNWWVMKLKNADI